MITWNEMSSARRTVIWNDLCYLESVAATCWRLFGAVALSVTLAEEARISKMHDFGETRKS